MSRAEIWIRTGMTRASLAGVMNAIRAAVYGRQQAEASWVVGEEALENPRRERLPKREQ